ncbi:MAG: ABC transporter permease [Limnochordia bacterium]
MGRKLLGYLILLFLALSLNFFLPRLMPGDPLLYLAGEEIGRLDGEGRAALRAHYGLDRTLSQQFALYWQGLLLGDWGFSLQKNQPVRQLIAARAPWTILLVGSSLVLSTLLGSLLGILAGWYQNSPLDTALTGLCLILQGMPSFWLGMVFLALFGAQLGWFPLYGAYNPWANYHGWAYILDVGRHLILPLSTLSLLLLPQVFLTMRATVIQICGEGFIFMARAKGLPERAIIMGHVARNALLPVFTLFMIKLGQIFSGTTIIETVFAYPGLGRLMYEGIITRDYPVIQGAFSIITAAVIFSNLAAEILYPYLDPRVGE